MTLAESGYDPGNYDAWSGIAHTGRDVMRWSTGWWVETLLVAAWRFS